MNKIEKINSYIKKNIILIISFLIVLQPIIDLIVGISINVNFFPGITSFIRAFILLFLLYYFVIINQTKSKKKIFFLLGLILLYLLLYSVNMNCSVEELKFTLKVFYLPITFLILFSIFEEEKQFIDKKYLSITLGIYALIIIIAYVTNTAFESYQVSKVGSSGYFYAANEIGAIMAILMPFAFASIFKKINFKNILYLLIIITAILIMGTKTPLISFIICLIYFVAKLITKQNALKIGLLSLTIILIFSAVITLTPVYKNIIIHAEFLEVDNVMEIIENPELFDHFCLGSRLKFLNDNTYYFLESSSANKLLGVGYTNHPKLAEMDFNDILYRQGILGFALYFSIILSFMVIPLTKYNKNYILSIILVVLISTFVGHIITSAAASIFVAIILCGLVKEDKHES